MTTSTHIFAASQTGKGRYTFCLKDSLRRTWEDIILVAAWRIPPDWPLKRCIILGLLQHPQQRSMVFWLVVEPTHLKNISQNGFIFPNFRGGSKKYFSPPPSFMRRLFEKTIRGYKPSMWKYEVQVGGGPQPTLPENVGLKLMDFRDPTHHVGVIRFESQRFFCRIHPHTCFFWFLTQLHTRSLDFGAQRMVWVGGLGLKGYL